MTAASHTFPKFLLAMGTKVVSLNASDSIYVGLIGSTSAAYTWNSTSQGHTYVSDFLGGSGAGGLTEVSTSGTGYNRGLLTSVTYTLSGLVCTLTSAAFVWSAATINATYAFFYDNSVGGGDSSHPLLGYWDFGGQVPSSLGNWTLTPNASGIITLTAS